MINSNEKFSNMDIDALSDAELDSINGGSIWSWLKGLFGGPGDLRRPTDRPSDPVYK